MKVVIAIDSFKGSLSSLQAGTAAATGIYRVDPKVETVVRPLADGGEGTVQALTEGLGGRLVSVSVTGPAGKQVICPYGIIDRTQTAIIEMSGAAGITQVHGDEKIRCTPQRTVSVRLSAMPSAMAATALSLESAEVPQMTAVLVCYRHSVSDCSMQKENRFLLVLSDWNLLPRLRQITFCRNFRNAPSVLPAM